MNRSENYYQLPYSKVTVSAFNRKDKLALSEAVTDHSRLSASRSERGKDTTLDHYTIRLYNTALQVSAHNSYIFTNIFNRFVKGTHESTKGSLFAYVGVYVSGILDSGGMILPMG